MKTKSLSVRPEWAHAVMYLGKSTENRSWRTRYRGPLLIHASLRRDPSAREFAARLGLEVPALVPRGVILGSVVLVDVVDNSTSPWAEPGAWHWLLEDPQPWPEPVPSKGDLGLWDYELSAGLARRLAG
jgi:ASCH domain